MSEPKVVGYNDPNNPGNGSKYHTGKSCIEPGCERPAGTAWSPYWCFEHNIERIDRISGQFCALFESLPEPGKEKR